MIKSMTGFGRHEFLDSENGRKITAEVKSVNHRYLDLNIKMPRKFNFLENKIRNLIKKQVQRGKVDVFLLFESDKESTKKLVYNHDLAREYVDSIRQIGYQFSIHPEVSAFELAKFPEVFTMEEENPDEKALWEALEKALTGALTQFEESRLQEGDHLRRDMSEKLTRMLAGVEQVEDRQPKILEEYRAKLRSKVEELLGNTQIEESRLATELVIFADKISTDEESVRLKSHIIAVEKSLSDPLASGLGRKLDFIAQEMNREANTILSKSNDLETSDIAIDLKTDIEKIREQIQNIE